MFRAIILAVLFWGTIVGVALLMGFITSPQKTVVSPDERIAFLISDTTGKSVSRTIFDGLVLICARKKTVGGSSVFVCSIKRSADIVTE